MTQKSKIISGTLVYSLSNYTVIAIGFCLGIITKRILNVAGTGEWYFIFAFLPFGLYTDWGILNAIIRQIPRDIGAGNLQHAERIKDVAFTYIITCSFLNIILFLLVSLLFPQHTLIRAGIALLGLLVPLTLLYNLNVSLFWAHKEIKRLSLVIIINSLFTNALNIFFAMRLGSLGIVFSAMLTTFIMFFLSARIGRFRFRWAFDLQECKSLIRIGFPINLSAALVTVFYNVDKMVIGKFIGFEQLGLYTIAVTALTTTSKLPASFLIVWFPYLQEEFGKFKDILHLKGKLLRSQTCIVILLPLLLVFVFLFMSVIVHYFLPKFINGIPPMMVLVFGYYFMLIKDIPYNILYTINKQKYIVAVLVVLLLLYIPSIYFLALRGFGIISIAWATAVVYALYFTSMFVLGYRSILRRKEQVTFFLSILAVYAYSVISFLLINRFVSSGSVFLGALLKMCVFTAVYFPLLLYIEKKEGLLKQVVSLIFKKQKGRLCV